MLKQYRKFIVFVIIFNIIRPSYSANWVEYEESNKQGFIAYYDPTSIKRIGNFHTVKILKQYVESKRLEDENQELQYLSTVATQVIHCDTNVYRNKIINLMEHNDGSGKVIKSFNYAEKKNWNLMKRASIQETLHKIVCFNV